MHLLSRLGDLTTKVFRLTSTENPLQGLSRGDKMYLVFQLKIYEAESAERENPDPEFEKLERIHKLVEQVNTIGARIRSEIFEDESLKALLFRVSHFQELPKQLELFSLICSSYLDNLGARGHKQKISIGVTIVEASEFVRLKTGHYHDNHLTDLLQGVLGDDGQQDLDSDMIRKSRGRMKKNYPKLYFSAVDAARKAHGAGRDGAGMQDEVDFLSLLLNQIDDSLRNGG